MTEFKGFACWKDDQIDAVINTEAIGVSRQIFLATHVPFENLRVSSAGYMSGRNIHEKDVYEELFERAEEENDTFCIVKGVAGTGKSHFIRWFYEKYETEKSENDEAILIRRMDNSLKRTLEEILSLDVFDKYDPKIRKMRETLESATVSLGDQSVANRLRNAMQEAAFDYSIDEISIEGFEFSREFKDIMPAFLNEPSISEALLKSKGFQRIIPYLTGKNGKNTNRPDDAGFVQEDFLFLEAFENRLDDLNAKVRPFIKDIIYLKSERKKVAQLLNLLLNQAVSKMTQITPDVLMTMFRRVREQLKQQGKTLTLLIEDITAFTGLDQALVDVLIAPSKDTDMCRLFSMIGITEGYYNGNLRDNIKQRAKYTINLDENRQTQRVITSQKDVVQFAARYLNAMRLAPDKIKEWNQASDDITTLPNACDDCPVQQTCHQAFGTYELSEWKGRKEPIPEIGLYPFNARALWTMFDNMNPGYSRTPRTFLDHILATVMRSHRHKIPEMRFPPAPEKLGGGHFDAPTLKNRYQKNFLGNGPNAERAESLIVFWGDRTVYETTGEDQQKHIGEVPAGIFEAFGVVIPDGEKVGKNDTDSQDVSNKSNKPAEQPPSPFAPPVKSPVSVRESTATTEPERHPFSDRIQDWERGKTLDASDKILSYVRSWLLDAIDWVSYNIPNRLVEERVSLRYFDVEGELRQSQSNMTWHFPRDDETSELFHALCDLNHRDNLRSSELSAHMRILSQWLQKYETAFVDFVYQPEDNIAPPATLIEMVTACMYGFGILSGNVPRKDPENLFDWQKNLVQLARDDRFDPRGEADKLRGKRSRAWVKLLNNSGKHFSHICECFLDVINIPQGTGKTDFYDSSRSLEVLSILADNNWQLPFLDIDSKNVRGTWDSVYKCYDLFQKQLNSTIESEKSIIQDAVQEIRKFIGEHHTPDDLYQRVRDLNDKHEKYFKRNDVNSFLSRLEKIAELDGAELFASLAKSDQDVETAHSYHKYLKELWHDLDSTAEATQRNLERENKYQEAKRLRESKLKSYRKNRELARKAANKWQMIE